MGGPTSGLAGIDKYIEQHLAAGDAPATINRTTKVLGQAYALAVNRKTLTGAPSIRHLSEAGSVRQGFLSEAEFTTLLTRLPGYLADFTHFGFITGMRKGEIASLEWSDIEGDVLTLRGENSKNGEARTIPLVGELAEIMERRKRARQIERNGTAIMVEFIFHRDGQPVGDFRKAWKTSCEKAGLSGRLFHDLRRSAVRNMMRAGNSQAEAMKISGHKTASMFERYNIVRTDDLKKTLKKTEEYRRREAAKQKVVKMRRP